MGTNDDCYVISGHALSIFGHLGVDPSTGDLPVPERERRIADFKLLFGDPTFREQKLTVPDPGESITLPLLLGLFL